MFTIDQYQDLTGICTPANKQVFVSAQIRKSIRILEAMLGFTLDPDLIDTNYYTEQGKVQSDFSCSCCTDDDPTLDDPDEVVFAYRLFPYNKDDRYLAIDPCSDVHAVKLVKNGVTFKTLDPSEYRLDYEQGIVRYLEQTQCWCVCTQPCNCVQLAVDADWLWEEIPEDLLDVLCEMTTYYGDQKNDIKSETLGSHSYTKFDRKSPETTDYVLSIIKKYAGPMGTVNQMPV